MRRMPKHSCRPASWLGLSPASLLIFPTGDGNAKQVFEHQPVKGAAFEGLFHTERGAGLLLIGQPNMETMTIDNPLVLPGMLSFLVYEKLYAQVKGLDAFPRRTGRTTSHCCTTRITSWPGSERFWLPSWALALMFLWRGRLYRKSPWLLWLILLSAPFPYIATTAGWMTAELGRQPWLVYGLLRTAEGASPLVHSGNALFTLLGFLGLYLLLGLLFLFFLLKPSRTGRFRLSQARHNTSELPV